MKIYSDRNWVIVKDKKKTPNVRANNVYYMFMCIHRCNASTIFWLNEQSIV